MLICTYPLLKSPKQYVQLTQLSKFVLEVQKKRCRTISIAIFACLRGDSAVNNIQFVSRNLVSMNDCMKNSTVDCLSICDSMTFVYRRKQCNMKYYQFLYP